MRRDRRPRTRLFSPRPSAIGYTLPMSLLRNGRLALMMFLNYVIWGSWYVTITTYLTKTLGFSDPQAGAVFSTAALASMISPFFVGMFADRFFATQRLMAVVHLIGAVLLLEIGRASCR